MILSGMGILRNIKGRRFGSLKVVSFEGLDRSRKARWKCQCDCGRTTVALGLNLVRDRTRSCGCGERLTHGLFRHPAYGTWKRMMRRCYDARDSNYPNWGGRGIAVCRRWRESFETFAADMGGPPAKGWSIERNDNDGDYSRENCRWIRQRDQPKNRRSTIRITLNGETQTLTTWATRLGLKPDTIRKRLKRGDPPLIPLRH